LTQIPDRPATSRRVLIWVRDIVSGRDNGEFPRAICLFTRDSFGRGLPKTADFVWEVWGSSCLPITLTRFGVVGDISDEEGRRHWATASELRVIGRKATISLVIGVNSGEFIISVKGNGSKFDVSGDASRLALRRGDIKINDLAVHSSDLADSKAHRELVSIKKSQIVVVDSIGVQALILVEDGSNTISVT